ncbi:MAG: FecR family protein [Mucilaginibacter sp.]|uniref:FecR family protein n=1 Tax=Mucilaginibacter sp. L3T2-6 TaxID=3062491 RepID=UPI002675E42C|nr:FecR family protein [Mucilaginibacter sp. L3T2-6]MDO3643362.1 FecR family protein [Mucilaginibacter sp. L3T2-6]MDV6215705.1 FecR family protein [Mucilaginibacter sp. L3T2-6]
MEDRYQELAKKWLDKTITPAEQEEFAAWYNAGQDDPVEIPAGFAGSEDVLRQRILNKINQAVKDNDKPRSFRIPAWLRYAAAVLFCAVGFAGYRVCNHFKQVRQLASHTHQQIKNDVLPGGNKATLTLANGKVINLSDVKNGLLTNQGQTRLKKDKDGRIIYENTDAKAVDSASIFNTINIPKGGQFQVVLSDGSKVWLNSASSLTFPTMFPKNERKVTITGEAYFEVTKNKHAPFRVITGKQTVEVLGTHFNINGYTDEAAIRTTLIQGSVKVSTDAQSTILKPEEQSAISNDKTGKILVNTVDIDDVLAWTSGNFQFEKAEIPLIMRQASRWYDVDVKYEGEIPHRRFTGSISRNVNLSELLKMLKYTGINFRIAGKTIIVTS